MSESSQAPVATTEPQLIAILRLNTVERGSSIEEDLKIDRPFRLVIGGITEEWSSNKTWMNNLQVVGKAERDYYLFEVDYDGVTYTLAPGDAVLIYDNGDMKGIVHQSDDTLKALYGILTDANRT